MLAMLAEWMFFRVAVGAVTDLAGHPAIGIVKSTVMLFAVPG